jgi:LAO/AO transport system kinase
MHLPKRDPLIVQDLIEQAMSGRRRALARLITLVENDESAARIIIQAIYAETGRAHLIGVTGSPGSGKSTLVNEMAKSLRAAGHKVGIVAVDPSSPFTGGALLGDRVRMQDLSGDSGVFIRSMASRGSLGGLARTTSNVVRLLDATGYDRILIETVGAGQAEVDIAATAHTTLVIEAPGMGDEIQTIKAGILEIADILVVNKADRPGADRTVRALKAMLQLGMSGRNGQQVMHHGQVMDATSTGDGAHESHRQDEWRVPVEVTVATEGKGITELMVSVSSHMARLKATGELQARELARSRQEVGQLLREEFISRLTQSVPTDIRDQVIASVAARKLDPYAAVDRLFAQVS